MHQIIVILAAAIGFLTGGHTMQPQDAIPPIGMGQAPHAATTPHAGTMRTMDAIPPIGM
jgi:hypothetical protein